MGTIRDILAVKGTRVHSVGPAETVYEAALKMNEHKIGGLVVKEGDRICGIITERDILQRVVAQRRDPGEALVRDVMTAEVVCCQPHTTVDEARGVMKNRRIRHLPVVEGEGLLRGIISIGDLNAFQNHSQEMTIHFLHQYIYGQV